MDTHKKIFVDGIMHLGDLIMSSTVFTVLKQAYPDSEIHYMVTANLTDVAALLPYVDKVLPYAYKSKGGFLDVYKMGKELAAEHYDIGISLDPRERLTLMKWFADIPVRISVIKALDRDLKSWEHLFYTLDTPLDDWDTSQHLFSESYFEITRRALQLPPMPFQAPFLKDPAEADAAYIDSLLKDIAPNQPKVAFSVETIEKRRNWEPTRFSAVADWLIDTYNAKVIITGIPAHRKTIDTILGHMTHADQVLDLSGKTTIPRLAALFRRMDLLVTLDTGSTHIAAAAGCGVVTLFSNNSPSIYQGAAKISRVVSAHLPCSGKNICIGARKCPDYKCIKAITVDMVTTEIAEAMKQLHY